VEADRQRMEDDRVRMERLEVEQPRMQQMYSYFQGLTESMVIHHYRCLSLLHYNYSCESLDNLVVSFFYSITLENLF
jgi:hypothetical protein